MCQPEIGSARLPPAVPYMSRSRSIAAACSISSARWLGRSSDWIVVAAFATGSQPGLQISDNCGGEVGRLAGSALIDRQRLARPINLANRVLETPRLLIEAQVLQHHRRRE